MGASEPGAKVGVEMTGPGVSFEVTTKAVDDGGGEDGGWGGYQCRREFTGVIIHQLLILDQRNKERSFMKMQGSDS